MKDVRELVKVKPSKWSIDSEIDSTNDRGMYVDQDPDDPSIWRAWWGEEDVGEYKSMLEAQQGADIYFEHYIYALLEAV